jgi:hypothetical protein
MIQVEGDGPDPGALGERLAQSALAQGAADLFDIGSSEEHPRMGHE